MIIRNCNCIFFLQICLNGAKALLFLMSLTRWLKPTAMDSRNINKVCVITINQGTYPLPI